MKLADALDAGKGNPYIKGLVQNAVAAVLKSGAHGAIKGLYAKALALWTTEPRASPPRSEGVSVEWDDDW